MKTVEIHGGHTIEVDEARLDNMELLDAIAEQSDVDTPNPMALSRMIVLLLGKEGRNKLYDLYRTEDGRVPSMDVSIAITEIFTGLGAKNS